MSKQIYIKRAELHQDAYYIETAFQRNNYGLVKNVQFISKTNDHGDSYNGVIVTIDSWYKSTNVSNLFEQFITNKNGIGKMWHANHSYWLVIEYKKNEPMSIVSDLDIDPTLPDNLRISHLENAIKTFSIQMAYLQKQNEHNEKRIMDYEDKESKEWMNLLLSASKIQDLDFEIKMKDKKIEELICKNACLAIENVRKVAQYDEMVKDMDEQCSFLKYLEEQASEMRLMLNETSTSQRDKKTN